MGQTVESVNRLIAVARRRLPCARTQPDASTNLDEAFGPSGGNPLGGGGSGTAGAGIARTVFAVCGVLRQDVARLGERLRNPTVVARPRNLIADLLDSRAGLRAGIRRDDSSTSPAGSTS